MTTVDPPNLTGDWQRDMDVWRAGVDEKLRHMATKEDLAHLETRLVKTSWRAMFGTAIGVASLVIAALKLLP